MVKTMEKNAGRRVQGLLIGRFLSESRGPLSDGKGGGKTPFGNIPLNSLSTCEGPGRRGWSWGAQLTRPCER